MRQRIAATCLAWTAVVGAFACQHREESAPAPTAPSTEHPVPQTASAPAPPDTPAVASDVAKRIVGVWELGRYDNIPDAEVPPAGMVNIVYVFHVDGRLRMFVPG